MKLIPYAGAGSRSEGKGAGPHGSRKKISRHPLIEQLIARRVQQRLTQRDLGVKALGSATGAPLWRWETEGRNPSLHNFIAWVGALGGIVKIEFPPEEDQ